MREAIRRLEDRIAAQKLLAASRKEQTVAAASPRATRTADGPARHGAESAGVHQNRGSADAPDATDEAEHADHADETDQPDHPDEPDETDEPDEPDDD
jgi:hypothetical protein